jgi:hypothetical protein
MLANSSSGSHALRTGGGSGLSKVLPEVDDEAQVAFVNGNLPWLANTL